jgi:hypothetical protein
MSPTLDENENTTLRFAAIYILLSSFSPLDGGGATYICDRDFHRGGFSTSQRTAFLQKFSIVTPEITGYSMPFSLTNLASNHI